MKTNQIRHFSFAAAILIATQLVAACAPAVSAAQAPQPALPQVAPTMAPMTGSTTPTSDSNGAAGTDPLVFQQAVRKLWEDHVTWTRVYIIAAVAGLPEADTAAQRLLQNQTDIGNSIKPFYGEQAGDQLTALLKDHILIAAELLADAKSGDTAKFDDAHKRWHANADQIAAFLSAANPESWPQSDMQAMMTTHLELTLAEATARLKQDWPADVVAYDKVHDEILQMADMISTGIIQQFPDKFTSLKVSPKAVELTLAMNKLWEDHVTWTRTYIMSVTSGLPDADTAAQRLLQNQVDIGTAIKPIYGDQAGAQLTALLRDHILTAADLLAAAKSGDSAKFQAANTHWYDNGNQIAAFLNSANSANWPLADMQSMMKSHLDLTLAEATARLHGDWPGDVAAYDKVDNEILDMAGMLTQGILAQYPDKFQ